MASPEILPVWTAEAKAGENGYPAPTNARKGHFRPKKQNSTRNQPKHLRPGMICQRIALIQ
jgi:hypothetical protein